MTEPPPSGDPPTHKEDRGAETQRRYAQLLKLHEEVLAGLESLRSQADSPALRDVVRGILEADDPYAETAAGRLGNLTRALDDALRAVRLAESELRREMSSGGRSVPHLEELPDLPAPLARFIDERREDPGFRYEVMRDPVRGWAVRWKEYAPDGVIRGRGQFYERPHAWTDEPR